MTAAAPREQSRIRGWCPGALRPMESGDGLLVRVRPRAGRLATGDVIAIAAAAERYGNGLIDLTRRANLQLRGLSDESLPDLWGDLSRRRLIDASADAEAVRNVMVTPLASVAAHELARALEAALLARPELWQLPGKFCFSVDDERSVLPLDEERADIRLVARSGAVASVAIGCDRADAVAWLGSCAIEAAVEIAIDVAVQFLALRDNARIRLHDLGEPAFHELQHSVAADFDPLPNPPADRAAGRDLGKVLRAGELVAVGVAAPFGRVEAGNLRAFAAAVQKLGIAEFHISPWRALYLPVAKGNEAEALLNAAGACGFIVDAGNPLASIDACPGAPGCRSGLIDTRAVAAQLAPLLTARGWRSCHVSGCAKGCARSTPADLTLVGTGEGLAVMRYDTAQGVPRTLIPLARLSDLPLLLKDV